LLRVYASLGHTSVQAAKEVGALYAVIAKNAANPEDAAERVKNLLDALNSPERVAALEKAGVKVFDSDEDRLHHRQRSLTAIGTDIANLDDEHADNVGDVIGHDTVQALHGAAPQIQAKLDVTGNVQDFLASGGKAVDGFEAQIQRLQNTIEKFSEDHLTGALKSVTKALGDLNDPLAAAVIAFEGLRVLKEVTGLFSGFQGGLTALASVFGLSEVLLVIGALVAIAAAAFLIYEFWEPIKQFFKDLWEEIKTTFWNAVDWIGTKLGELADAIKRAFDIAVGWVGKKALEIGDAFQKAFDATVAWAKVKGPELEKAIGDALDRAVAWAKVKGPELKAAIEDALGRTLDWAKREGVILGEALGEALGKALDWGKGKFATIKDEFGKLLTDLQPSLDAFAVASGKLFDALSEKAIGIFHGLRDVASEVLGGIVEGVDQVVGVVNETGQGRGGGSLAAAAVRIRGEIIVRFDNAPRDLEVERLSIKPNDILLQAHMGHRLFGTVGTL
ncbi:MAG TPA: hypothetical protein VKT70_02285, partial [Stellaceae bacterium]|nr:hypothetical protein [Stellaceae bacterium]